MPSFLHAPRLSATWSGCLSPFRIKFLTRPGCHLCDDARPLVEGLAAKMGAVVEEINIDEDDALVALYGMRIPVLLGSGDEVIAEGLIVDRRVLKREVSKAMKLQPE